MQKFAFSAGLFSIFRRAAAGVDGPCRCSSTSPLHFSPFSVHKQFTLHSPSHLSHPFPSSHLQLLPISIPFPLRHTRSSILISSLAFIPRIPLVFNTFLPDALGRRLFLFRSSSVFSRSLVVSLRFALICSGFPLILSGTPIIPCLYRSTGSDGLSGTFLSLGIVINTSGDFRSPCTVLARSGLCVLFSSLEFFKTFIEFVQFQRDYFPKSLDLCIVLWYNIYRENHRKDQISWNKLQLSIMQNSPR